MSLVRTALRLCALEALRPTASLVSGTNPAGGPWPTIARSNVFDAKTDTFDDLVVKQRTALIAVYTDDDTAEPGNSAGGPPFKRFIDLGFEISVAQMAEDPDNPGKYIPMVPVTDPEAEASLDLLESSIAFTLIYGPTGALFRKISGNRILSIRSQPGRTAEEAIRLALRSISYRIQVNDDCFDLAPVQSATGLDRLPEPLRSVVALLPAASYGRGIAAGLAEFAPNAPVPVRPFTLAAGIDATQPPDGEPDVAFTVTPPQT